MDINLLNLIDFCKSINNNQIQIYNLPHKLLAKDYYIKVYYCYRLPQVKNHFNHLQKMIPNQALFTKPSTSQLQKDSLNKYKKKPSPSSLSKPQQQQTYSKQSTRTSSANQFQKYFLDTTNVFYQDRQTLKQLKTTRTRLKILIPLWFFLAISYLIISRIHVFSGVCPENATCKVFIRCNPGYELSQDGRRCDIRASIIQEIQNICKFQVQQLKHQYGDNDCKQDTSLTNETPYKRVDEIIRGITGKFQTERIRKDIQRRIDAFLNNQTNQVVFQFQCIGGKVIPLAKKHTFTCWMQLTSKTVQFKILSAIIIIVIVLTIWQAITYKRQQKVRQIYNFLKEKVIQQNKVNVTLLTDQIKSIYGQLDEGVWVKIDQERKKDGKIGYFQDQFLYWKMIV